MKFKATEDQVKNLMAVAVNASKPMGLGFVSYTDKVFAVDDFDLIGHLDYVEGRMVKLYIFRELGDDNWSVNKYSHFNNIPNIGYNSWASIYPTYEELFNAAGIVEFENS